MKAAVVAVIIIIGLSALIGFAVRLANDCAGDDNVILKGSEDIQENYPLPKHEVTDVGEYYVRIPELVYDMLMSDVCPECPKCTACEECGDENYTVHLEDRTKVIRFNGKGCRSDATGGTCESVSWSEVLAIYGDYEWYAERGYYQLTDEQIEALKDNCQWREYK